MQKIVHIVGPTAVGKTDLAVSLAQKFNGQLISADSVQVYKLLDIISGKDIPKDSHFIELEGFKTNFQIGYYNFSKIPIFLLDVVSPLIPFSVSDFKILAFQFIDHIQRKNKLPIVVGGTGFYIKALIDDFDKLDIPPDLELRSSLKKLDLESLKTKLKDIDSQKFNSMNNSDVNNPRRLIRAIEIAKTKNHELRIMKKEKKYQNLVIGLMCEREILKRRIEKRVESRLENGAFKEAEFLFKKYDNLCQQVKDANGYKQLFSYLKKEITYDEAIIQWKLSEYHHAKNQMTWFKKFGNAIWFDVSKNNFKNDIEKEIKNFLA